MKWKVAAAAVIFVSVLIGYCLYDDFDPQQLKDKNVVITGASEGIGEQLAYTYARSGARILITARTESKLKKVVEQCRKEGRKDGAYFYHVADMAQPHAGVELIQVAKEKLGGIDFLVLNHIISSPPSAWMSSAENITYLETVININFLAYVRLASAAMSSLVESHGSIVVLSSLAGKVPQPYLISYSSSKFALDGFFGGLKQEFAIDGVDVSITICYIALTNTTNAITNVQGFRGGRIANSVSIASPVDVAYAIVRGGTKRQPFVFYPYYGRPSVIAYNMFPSVIEQVLNRIYRE